MKQIVFNLRVFEGSYKAVKKKAIAETHSMNFIFNRLIERGLKEELEEKV